MSNSKINVEDLNIDQSTIESVADITTERQAQRDRNSFMPQIRFSNYKHFIKIWDGEEIKDLTHFIYIKYVQNLIVTILHTIFIMLVFVSLIIFIKDLTLLRKK